MARMSNVLRPVRLLTIGALCLALLGGALPGSSAAPLATSLAAPGAHLRLEVTSSSDWASVGVEPVVFQVSKVVGDATGVSLTDRSVRVDGSRTSVVDVVVPVLSSSDITFRVRKGVIGATTVVVRQIDAAGSSKVVTRIVNRVARDALNEVAVTVPSSAFAASAIELGATDPERLVIAAFYPWWSGTESARFVPDKPTGTWTSSTTAAIATQLRQMAGAGINTVALSMGWPQYDRQQMAAITINAARAQRDIRLVPYVELEVARTAIGWSDAALDHIIGEAAAISRSLPGTFVQRGGRPVLFFFADQQVPADIWNASVARVEATQGPIFAVTHSVDPARRTDGIHSYLDLGTEGDRWGQAYARTVLGRYWPIVDPGMRKRVVVGTVNPGHDDTAVRPWTARVASREGGQYYQRSWDIAEAARPDWIFITSWNEWWEQTHIAPSTVNGSAALDITRTRAQAFRPGG